jgi:hypothetical protein
VMLDRDARRSRNAEAFGKVVRHKIRVLFPASRKKGREK